ncbi:MAG: beta-galactosidase, partial [Planctomycetota bacterium]
MTEKSVHPSTTRMTNETFLVGTQYFRAPTPMPEDWEPDLENIRNSGMNIIRLWLVWSWMNPAPGKYDFEDVEKLLDLCKKYDIRAVLLTSLEAAPAWMIREHQKCHYISRKGLPRLTTSGANLTPGGFPGLCPDHEIVREKGAEWIAATAKHFAGHDVVYAWEPQNEPMMEGARYHDEVYCYCQATLKRFREWLQRKYETLEALGTAWRQKHSCWEDVLPPREGGSWPDWIDFRNFALDNINDHIVWRKKAISDNAPNHAILMHGRANTGGLLDTNTQVIDDWRLAKLVDLYGQAAFPGRMGDVDYPLSMEVTRSSCYGKVWWQAELQGGGHGMGTGRHFVLRGDKLAYWSWVAVAMGAKAVLYWQYRPERMGYEYGFGLTDLDGSGTDRTEAVKKLGTVLNKHAELFNTAKEQNNDVALTCSPNSYIIHGVSEFMATAPIDSIKGIYAALMEGDLGADVIRADEEAVDDDYNKYKMIFMPCPTWISQRTAQKLRDFVSNGGTLVSEASLAQYDERLLASTMVPGMGMDEVFGVRRAESEILSVEETGLNYKK